MSLFRERTEVVLAVLLFGSLVLVTPRIAESDAVEYFSYLPSVLLDFDLDFEDEYTVFYKEDPEGRAGFKETFLDRSTATGLKLNFGPIGSALLWSPFYIATHLVVGSPDGMSQPYRTAVSLASAFYGALGLLLCYRLARRYAEPLASFAAVAALWWATPVAYYMYIAPGMSHACSLFSVALFFTLWPWASRGGVGRWALWGASAGLMALVREQDVFFAVAALFALRSASEPIKRLLAFGAGAVLVFLPQLVVYQILNGNPTPSPHVQDKMAWHSPHSLEVLFSTEHGLFFWSPILLLFLAGGLLLIRREQEAGLALLAGFLAQVFISGAVDSWTQAGAFGARRFVGASPIFAVWGAMLFAALKPRLHTAGIGALVSVFVLWNVSLMVQFGLGLMCRDRLVWSEIVHNHVHEVPPRLLSVVESYVFARGELQESK
ncbi:MAG: glycosyltransferase family 39 protein [Vicinamibacteria bacterium]